jgi:glycosyltransferase involved in cell wall biosynthesis
MPTKTQLEANFPFVSVLTPTYNRSRFFPSLIEIYKSQKYPKNRMEWIILDDGQEDCTEILEKEANDIPNIRYIRLAEKINIGAKRNRLNQEAKGEIHVAMDDDDFYFPERVSAVVTAFKNHPKIELAGSSEIYMYYSDIQTIYKMGPYSQNHATNGTMAWRSSYAKTHRYDEDVTHSEERSFLDDYVHPMIQLDPFKVMLVMSHSENTFDKKKLRLNENPFVKRTGMKMKDFIKDKKLREFYSKA